MNLLLKDVRWEGQRGDVRIGNSIILETGVDLSPRKREAVLQFDNHFIYPGLINSHDHLEMNIYPKLGSPPYPNYIEWAKDIYKPKSSPIREIQKIGIQHRLVWGGMKNLISGCTTVIHHNPWHSTLDTSQFPVNVLKNFRWAHSLAFAKKIPKLYSKNSAPFIIHAGEGVDDIAKSEIAALDNQGLVNERCVLVHAVAIDEVSSRLIYENKASVVWCPASNLFLFHKTAPVTLLKKITKLALGTDSTLTGSPTLLEELRIAATTNLASAQEIFSMVTDNPAAIFGLEEPAIKPGTKANLFVSAAAVSDYLSNLLQLNAEGISVTIVNGRPRLVDATHSAKFGLKHTIHINGQPKSTDVDVRSLKANIRKHVGEEILCKNPLWNLIGD